MKFQRTPDALQNQQILAGMVDAGASAVAMEISDETLLKGHIDSVDVDIIVFTNSPRMTSANNDEDNEGDQQASTSASSDEDNEDENDEEKVDTEEEEETQKDGDRKEEDAFETKL